MIKILRRIVFFAFLAVFLIGAPKIVFYALGYSYHPGEEKGLVKTGLIYLSTAPPGASIYVGGRRYHEPTPAIIRDLIPGNYPIRLTLKDHEVWNRVVPVEAAKASVLGKILLYPKKPDWHTRISERFEDFTAISDTSYFLIKKSQNLNSIQVYDWKNKKSTQLFNEETTRNLQVAGFRWMPGSTHVLFEGMEKNKKKWAWVDLDEEDHSKIIWTDGFSEKFEKIIWSEKTPKHLFALEKTVLNRFDPDKNLFVPLSDKVRGYGVYEKKLFLLTEDNQFISTDFSNKNPKVLMKDSDLFRTLFGNETSFEVQHVSDDITIFLGKNGKLIVNQSAYPLVEKGVLGFHFDKKHRKAVIWTKDAIGLIEFPKEKKEQGSFRKHVKVDWILRQAQSIQRVFWAHDGAYLIFQDQNKVLILELETFGSPSLHELLETKRDSQVFYSDDSGELFYLDKKTGNLMSLEVIPKWKVLEIPFSILQEKEKEGKIQP